MTAPPPPRGYLCASSLAAEGGGGQTAGGCDVTRREDRCASSRCSGELFRLDASFLFSRKDVVSAMTSHCLGGKNGAEVREKVHVTRANAGTATSSLLTFSSAVHWLPTVMIEFYHSSSFNRTIRC